VSKDRSAPGGYRQRRHYSRSPWHLPTPFSWEIDASPHFHVRSITTDPGWKISLDRGLDVFQWFEFSPFNAAAVMQEARMVVKGCELNYMHQAKA